MAGRRLTTFLELEDEEGEILKQVINDDGTVKTSKKEIGNILWRLLKLYVPILDWITKYGKKNIMPDIMAGITVGIVCISNGLANANLAKTPTLYGIYTGMVPAVMYTIFGSAYHLNIGVFPLMSVMGAVSVQKYVNPEDDIDEYLSQMFDLTIMVGIILILCGTLRLGAITALLSDSVLAGFTAGSAYNIAASQLKHLFGAEKYAKSAGPFFQYLIDLFEQWDNFNWAAFGICFSALIILIGGKWLNKKYLPKYMIPFELIVVIFYTFISGVGKFDKKAGIAIVGEIKKGYPKFRAPHFKHFGGYLASAIPLALIGYVISISSGKSMGRQFGYRVRPNQELRAVGFGCLMGGFTESFPLTGSISRSYCAGSFGANVTPLYNIYSFILLTLVVLFIGPILQYLPQAILGALVISAFDKIYVSIIYTYKIFFKSKLEFLHWWVAFICTITLDTELGLYIGIGFCLLTQIFVILKEAHEPGGSYYREFVRLFGFDVYHDHISDTSTIKFRSSLHYLNIEVIFNKFLSLFNKNPPKYKYVFDFENVKFMDITSVNMFADILKLYYSKKISLSFSHMSKDVTNYLKSFDIPVINDVFKHTVDQYTFCMDTSKEFTQEELEEEGRSAVTHIG